MVPFLLLVDTNKPERGITCYVRNNLSYNNKSVMPICPEDVKNQIKYCKMFGLKKLTESPTRITCSTSSIIGHILLNFPSRVTRQWMLNFELVDHKLL